MALSGAERAANLAARTKSTILTLSETNLALVQENQKLRDLLNATEKQVHALELKMAKAKAKG